MPVPAKLKITLYALDEQMQPGELIMSVAMYADNFPEDGSDHDKQRFIKKAKNNYKDGDLLNMFTKVQALDKTDVVTVKNLLKAFIFQEETQQRLAQ